MEKIGSISSNNGNVPNNKQTPKTQSYLLKEPIQDSVELSDKKRKQQTTLKWLLGGIATLATIFIAIRIKKSINVKRAAAETSKQIGTSVPEEAIDHVELKPDKKHEEFMQKLEEKLNQSNEDVKKAQEEAKTAQLGADKAKEKYGKIVQKTQEEIRKNQEEIKELEKLLEEMKKAKEANQKSWEDFNKNWDKSQEESKKQWEKYWEESKKTWEDFYRKMGNSLLNSESKNKAEAGVNVFKNFGKDADGKVFEEIKELESIETLTEEKIKKALWKMAKKYVPLINSGTDIEKAEATEVMQQINPACDDIRLYLKSK